jgi:eukaryotic-like serine/threonine-protein kinase
MKKNIIVVVIIIIILVIVGIYFWNKGPSQNVVNQNPATTTTPLQSDQAQKQAQANSATTVIGKSVEGRDIIAYNYGTGDTRLLFIGGIHGGYEWNTALVAYQLMDYLKANPDIIPENVKVTVIPVLNPDGLNKVVGTSTGNFTQADVSSSQTVVVAGRFNSNNVDLNRNFDCDWQSVAKWQSKTVSGGDAAFSEPESQAIENYVDANKPTAVVVWYSAAGGVYASSCHNGVLPATNTLTDTYADASGYPAYESFDFYATTGDMVNWLAKNNIPAISVLLTNHTDTEWTKNQAGVQALLKYYSK